MLVAANVPAPARPQLPQGPRVAVAPAPALAPRIPNLLVTNRRAQWSTNNPVIVPAAAVTTPAVNDTSGTPALDLLAPFTREQVVEIAPPPAPLGVGEAPYVQSPAAPDDADAPARVNELPAREPLK